MFALRIVVKMNEVDVFDVCGTTDRQFALNHSGELAKNTQQGWRPYSFNKQYAGYYPACKFSRLVYLSGRFLLAGTDENDAVRLFMSFTGDEWEQENTTQNLPLMPPVLAKGDVVAILEDEKNRQLYLVCKNGQLVTMPDCPKCVKIQQVANSVVSSAKMQNDEILLFLADGSERVVNGVRAAQQRISVSYMRSLISEGALLIDVRSKQVAEKSPVEGSLCVPSENLLEWLRNQSTQQVLIFVCHTGALADAATMQAKRLGFSRVYSLGGVHALAHIE